MKDKENLNASKSELEDIQRLGSSLHFLKLAESILNSLDRETLSEMMAAYFYMKSKGKRDREIFNFIITRKTIKVVYLALNALLSCVPGLISDDQFRAVISQYVFSSIKKRARSFASSQSQTRRQPNAL
jgi:hypothetical protein